MPSSHNKAPLSPQQLVSALSKFTLLTQNLPKPQQHPMKSPGGKSISWDINRTTATAVSAPSIISTHPETAGVPQGTRGDEGVEHAHPLHRR
eukprot:2595403-Prymnesium_polylepis.2